MKKIIIFAAIVLLSSCTSTKDIVDYDLFKNELNDAIKDGFPDSDYTVK